LWSFSTLYDKGRFVADHRFDPNAESRQAGAAVILKQLVRDGDIGPLVA
jgi:lysozyme family protein